MLLSKSAEDQKIVFYLEALWSITINVLKCINSVYISSILVTKQKKSKICFELFLSINNTLFLLLFFSDIGINFQTEENRYDLQ